MKDHIKVIISNDQTVEKLPRGLRMLIRRCCNAVLVNEQFKGSAEISVTIVDDEKIHELNKKYRNVDRSTDVLSFPLYENGEFDDDVCKLGAPLGDIVISIPRAREQAEELGNSFVREVAFLAVHSTLHLLGYDHERSREDDELQCRLQKEIIETLELE